jgi:hypothetical protein
MPEVDGAGDREGDEGRSQESVGNAAMVFKDGDGAAKSPENIEIGGLGGEGHGQGGVGGAAIESGAGEYRSGEEVSDWFHWLTV